MTTIHLTDAQCDTFAACCLIIIDGDICPTCHGYPNDVTLDDDCNITAITPKSCCVAGGGLVAPAGWRSLTEPCDTCAGKGKLGKYPIFNGPSDLTDCPDCVGGRRVVTLTATCPKCKGVGVSQAGAYACSAAGCLGSGVVTLGRFTIPALLPVGGCPDCVPKSIVPVPRPGQFIARPERVE